MSKREALDSSTQPLPQPADDPAGPTSVAPGRAGLERVRAIRGATTLEADTRQQIISRTQELLAEILARNELHQEDVVSIVFTATDDISSAFPAEAAREAGIALVPLLCARELEIEGGIKRCIRVLLHVYTTRAPTELRHVYQYGARQLRTDLPE